MSDVVQEHSRHVRTIPERSGPRLLYDISTIARWSGTPVGIIRADRELALWAREHRPDAVFCFYDPATRSLRHVVPGWVDQILGGRASVNTWGLPAPRPHRPRKTERIPESIRPAAMWVLQPRRQLVAALERVRLRTGNLTLLRSVARLQLALTSERNRRELFDTEGRRRAYLPLDLAIGPELVPNEQDTFVTAGSGWTHLNIEEIRALKLQHKFRLVMMCYDIIPIQFPEFYRLHDVEAFREYFEVIFPLADRVIFSARTIEADARAYCESRGLPLGDSKVVPLGADVAKLATSEPLLEDLSPDRYAVFVSTIEPRKGHALLYRVWRRLLAEGVPQATGFKLVFVGRMGWMVDKLMHDLQTDPKVRGNLLMLQNVSDETLVTLYRNAAFCLYPSLYEGYGLPVIEAFTHGKAVLASSGGALPESVDEFSPCLDPRDEDAWHRMLRQWITDPSARAPYEQAIRERYRRPTWNETAERFFRAAMEQSPAPVVSMRAPSTAPAK